jgi:hypothetical protein
MCLAQSRGNPESRWQSGVQGRLGDPLGGPDRGITMEEPPGESPWRIPGVSPWVIPGGIPPGDPPGGPPGLSPWGSEAIQNMAILDSAQAVPAVWLA